MASQASDEVVEDYRTRILIDGDSPILAAKALRDRYTKRHGRWAGYPHLGSRRSEDALTWNLFRSLQVHDSLSLAEDVLLKRRSAEKPGLLLWSLAPDPRDTELQYLVGSCIRRHDGILAGQVTEPDVIMVGDEYVAVVECKLGKPGERPGHLWGAEATGRANASSDTGI